MSKTNFQSLSNHFLVAMPALEDSNFSRTVTLICQHNSNGALGVTINRTIKSLNINDILHQCSLPKTELVNIGQQPVYVGGPIHTELGLVLHRGVGTWQSTLNIGDQLGLTSSRDVFEAIANSGGPDDCLLVLGYAGWEAGQLDREIGQNSWLTVPADPSIIFEVDVEQRWAKAATSLGINIAALSRIAGHA
jgi:putative transcriptional regulator